MVTNHPRKPEVEKRNPQNGEKDCSIFGKMKIDRGLLFLSLNFGGFASQLLAAQVMATMR